MRYVFVTTLSVFLGLLILATFMVYKGLWGAEVFLFGGLAFVQTATWVIFGLVVINGVGVPKRYE